ncbi:MAG: amino acid permease, partial [Thermoplasmata archaeon]|nr:amino acid permease [Thermoplasmata archaeon]
ANRGTGGLVRLAESSAAQAAERTVFARKTSGLVKELGAFESFSINLISLGPGPAYGLFLIILLFVSGANLMQATLLAALVGIPVLVAYAIMSIEMPRSGGEYVYASRLLHPYFGFVSGMSRVLNVILYAAILPYWFVTLSLGPGLASWGSVVGDAGFTSLGSALTANTPTTNTTWIVLIGEVLTLALMVLWIAMKPRLAFRIFSILLILELAGLVTALVLLFAAGHTGFVNAVNAFMASQGYTGNYYADVSNFGATNFGAYGADFSHTLIFVPLVFAFYYMFAGAPSYIAGEFRRTSRSISLGMAVSFSLAVAFAAAIVFAFEAIVGMDFLNGSVGLSYGFGTSTDPTPLPFAPGLTALPNLVAGRNPILLAVMFLGSVSWYILWLILGLYIFSRFALSFSLDRLFPMWLGNVSRRTHQPWTGIVVVSLIGAILLPLVTLYYNFVYLPSIFLLFFLPMVTVALTSVSLVRLGLQKHRTGYVAAGLLATAATVASGYLVSTLPLLGEAAGFTPSNQTTGYVTILLVFVGSAIWYWGARWFHLRKHAVDISMAFKALPPD